MVRESYEQFVTDRDEDTFGGDIVAVASPATTLVLGYLLLTLVVGTAVGSLLYYNPELFGEQGYARLAGLVVLGLTAIGVLRLAIKYVVLLRTKYIVTEDSVRREYTLAYREEARELPLHMIRGVETSKSRMQALLGYATISFLAVGSNRGIGYVEFDNAAHPEKLQTAVLELLERQRERAVDDADRPAASAGPNAVTMSAADDGEAAQQRAANADAAGGAADATGAAAGTADAAAGTNGAADAGSEPDRASSDATGSGSVFGDDALADAESEASNSDDPRRPVSEADDGPTGGSK